jgi:hypothetical protein
VHERIKRMRISGTSVQPHGQAFPHAAPLMPVQPSHPGVTNPWMAQQQHFHHPPQQQQQHFQHPPQQQQQQQEQQHFGPSGSQQQHLLHHPHHHLQALGHAAPQGLRGPSLANGHLALPTAHPLAHAAPPASEPRMSHYSSMNSMLAQLHGERVRAGARQCWVERSDDEDGDGDDDP